MNSGSGAAGGRLSVYRSNHYQHRRAYVRLNMEASAQILQKGKSGSPAEVKDISVRGMRVVVNFPLSIGERMSTVVYSPYVHDPIQHNVSVQWCRQLEGQLWEAGVEFAPENKMQLA